MGGCGASRSMLDGGEREIVDARMRICVGTGKDYNQGGGTEDEGDSKIVFVDYLFSFAKSSDIC